MFCLYGNIFIALDKGAFIEFVDIRFSGIQYIYRQLICLAGTGNSNFTADIPACRSLLPVNADNDSLLLFDYSTPFTDPYPGFFRSNFKFKKFSSFIKYLQIIIVIVKRTELRQGSRYTSGIQVFFLTLKINSHFRTLSRLYPFNRGHGVFFRTAPAGSANMGL